LTNRDIWDRSVKQDLSGIAENSLKNLNQDIRVLPAEKLQYLDYILTNIQGIQIKIANDTFQINAEPWIASVPIRESYKSVYDKFENLKNAFGQLSKISFQDVHVYLQNKDTISATLDRISSALDSIKTIFQSKDYTILRAEKFKKSIDSVQVLVTKVAELFRLMQTVADEKMGNTYRVLNSFDLFEYIGGSLPDSAFASTKLKDDYDKDFKSFKSYALFLLLLRCLR
jgi:hypothetical protein